jgi:thioesterase domain-containing protein
LAILDSREPLRESAEDSKPAGLIGAFGRRIRRGWRRRRKRLRKSVPASLRRLRFALYFALHRPLPTDLRPYYTAYLGGVARARYRPKPYPGDVLLICTRTRRPRAEAGWGALCEGTLTCVGVRGKHKDIFSPHHVAELAGALQGHLPPEPTGV